MATSANVPSRSTTQGISPDSTRSTRGKGPAMGETPQMRALFLGSVPPVRQADEPPAPHLEDRSPEVVERVLLERRRLAVDPDAALSDEPASLGPRGCHVELGQEAGQVDHVSIDRSGGDLDLVHALGRLAIAELAVECGLGLCGCPVAVVEGYRGPRHLSLCP